MKVTKFGIELGAAFEEAEPIEISYGFASITAFINEGGDLVITTKRGQWHIESNSGGSDIRLIIENN